MTKAIEKSIKRSNNDSQRETLLPSLQEVHVGHRFLTFPKQQE